MAFRIRFGDFALTGAGLSEDAGRGMAQGVEGAWTPAVDIYETMEEVVIVADLAGVESKTVQVMVDGQVVRIYGERPQTCCSQVLAHFHRMEIETGPFVRNFRITVPFEAKGISARSKDGFLTIKLPKPPQTNIDVEQG